MKYISNIPTVSSALKAETASSGYGTVRYACRIESETAACLGWGRKHSVLDFGVKWGGGWLSEMLLLGERVSSCIMQSVSALFGFEYNLKVLFLSI